MYFFLSLHLEKTTTTPKHNKLDQDPFLRESCGLSCLRTPKTTGRGGEQQADEEMN
jgi:hypothetical protein